MSGYLKGKSICLGVLLVAALGGCSSAGDSGDGTATASIAATPSTQTTLDNGLYVSKDEDGQRYWVEPAQTQEQHIQELLERYDLDGVEGVPEHVDVIRERDNDDYLTIHQCLEGRGFPMTQTGEDRFEISVPEEQTDAFNIAQHTCELEYPIDSETQHAPYNEEQIGRVYDWQTGEARECFEAHGINVSDPPSRQQFIDEWFNGMNLSWWLGDFAPVANDDLPDKICPIIPLDVYE